MALRVVASGVTFCWVMATTPPSAFSKGHAKFAESLAALMLRYLYSSKSSTVVTRTLCGKGFFSVVGRISERVVVVSTLTQPAIVIENSFFAPGVVKVTRS